MKWIIVFSLLIIHATASGKPNDSEKPLHRGERAWNIPGVMDPCMYKYCSSGACWHGKCIDYEKDETPTKETPTKDGEGGYKSLSCGKPCRKGKGKIERCPKGQRCRFSKDRCHMTCEADPREISSEDSRPARCGLELDIGSGSGKDRPRYFYSKATKQCEEFTYKGYEGNANNFKRKIYCESMCQDCVTIRQKCCNDRKPCKIPNCSKPLCTKKDHDEEFEDANGAEGNGNASESGEDCVEKRQPCCTCQGEGGLCCRNIQCTKPLCKKADE